MLSIEFRNGVSVLVKTDRGVRSERTVSTEDLLLSCAEVGRNLNRQEFLSTPLLPSNCLMYGETQSHVKLMVAYPSHRRTVVYGDRSTPPRVYENVLLPDLIWILVMTRKNNVFSVVASFMRATKDNLFSLNMPTWRVPFANISTGDNHLCWGSNSIPAVSNLRMLSPVMEKWMSSRMNADLGSSFVVPALERIERSLNLSALQGRAGQLCNPERAIRVLSLVDSFPADILAGPEQSLSEFFTASNL
jgi:hypothetical protein